MRSRASTIFTAVLLWVMTTASWAAVAPYGQDFEGLIQTDPSALGSDGWLVFGNVFDASMAYIYGYGPFPAPNGGGGGPAFSVIAIGEGGASQGVQQLSVFSDYENLDHANSRFIESNVYQEQTVSAGDVGNTWFFEFDAKQGDVAGLSTALAFIKTLDPSAGFALTNFITADMTSIPATWNRYSVSITIDASLVDQLLQFGFANTATNYEGSNIFYDNVEFTLTSTLVDVPPTATRGSGIQLSVRTNPAFGPTAQVLSFAASRNGRVSVRVYDVGGGLVATLLDRELDAGNHQVEWRGRDATGRATPSGIYFAEVVVGSERAIAKLSRLR